MIRGYESLPPSTKDTTVLDRKVVAALISMKNGKVHGVNLVDVNALKVVSTVSLIGWCTSSTAAFFCPVAIARLSRCLERWLNQVSLKRRWKEREGSKIALAVLSPPR